MKLTFVLFNRAMFSATGESDKPTFTIKLTEQQVEQLQKFKKDYMDILSIHVSLDEDDCCGRCQCDDKCIFEERGVV